MDKPRSIRALEWLNFFVADVQTGLGPFLAAYLAASGWSPALLFAFVGYHYGNRFIFLCSALFVLPTLACLWFIRRADIDPDHARPGHPERSRAAA